MYLYVYVQIRTGGFQREECSEIANLLLIDSIGSRVLHRAYQTDCIVCLLCIGIQTMPMCPSMIIV